MKKLSISIFCTLFTIITAGAQVNSRPGYIITNLNDTIYGTIDYRSAAQNAQYCIFQQNGTNEYKHYSPSDIQAYRFLNDGKYYVSRTIDLDGSKAPYFLEYLIKGIVSLYFLPTNDSDCYFVENELGEMTLIEIPDESVVGYEKARELKKQAVLSLYKVFDESVLIKTRLVNSGLNKPILTGFTKEYHNEICTSAEECVQFEYDRKERTVILDLHVGAGMAYHSISIEEWTKFGKMTNVFPALNVGIDFRLPRFSNHLFVQSMLSLSCLKAEKTLKNKTVNLESMVADLQAGAAYTFNGKKWNPILQAGVLLTTFLNSKSSEPIGVFESLSGNFTLNFGCYAGARLEYPLKNNALFLDAVYKYRGSSKFSTIGIGLGYKF